MKIKFVLIQLLLLVYVITNVSGQCTNCENTQNNGANSSAIGQYSEATGTASFASGYYSKALENYATSLGKNTEASGIASFAIGTFSFAEGNSSIAMGFRNLANTTKAIAIGSYVQATASNAIIIGTGYGIDNELINAHDHSIMMGNHSNMPTLFVSSSDGAGTTGRVAIGNMTDPQAKLHIYADDNEDATLLLEPSNWSGGKIAKLMLGTQDFWLKTGNSIGMQFNSPDGFILQAGNIQTVFIDAGQFEV